MSVTVRYQFQNGVCIETIKRDDDVEVNISPAGGEPEATTPDSVLPEVDPALTGTEFESVPPETPIGPPNVSFSGNQAVPKPLVAGGSQPHGLMARLATPRRKRTAMGIIRAVWMTVFGALGFGITWLVDNYSSLHLPAYIGLLIGSIAYGLKKFFWPDTVL